MWYKLTRKKTGWISGWRRAQRIEKWRIEHVLSGEYHIEFKEETRTPAKEKQWLDYRTLGAIKRVTILLNEIGSHPDAPPNSQVLTMGTYEFLDTLESNIRNKSKSKS